MSYIGPSIETGFRQRYVYTATAGQTSFSGNDSVGISLTYTDSEYLDVYQNGVLLVPGSDYTATTGTTVVLVTGASADDKVEMIAYQAFGVADTVSRADGGAFGGAVSMASTLAVTGASTLSSTLDVTGTTTIGNGTSGVAKINGGSSSSGQLIFMDAGTNRARIGVPTGTTTLSLSGSNTLTGDVVITADGEVTMPTQPAFNVHPASQQANIAINQNVTIVFGTERFDVGANFSSNTFTAPVTGKYLLTVNLYFDQFDASADYVQTEIHTSNYTYKVVDESSSNDHDTFSFASNAVVADMDANDTAIIRVFQGSGTAQIDIDTGSSFTGALIC
tara:strand:+ start:3798 stop:4799 length:1002 start_codon:yes stop_codon:yes gene_type:complete